MNFLIRKTLQKNKLNICVIGLGYVGLPLSIELAKKFKIIAYDTNLVRIKNLKSFIDTNNEISLSKIRSVNKNINFTNNPSDLENNNFYIITVPTPIDRKKKPDLKHLVSATKHVAKNLKKRDVVVYESTTYPGCTDEICIPLLEKISGLKIIKDFSCGYSPERINPGDKIRTIDKIDKIISASDSRGLKLINSVYRKIIKAKIIKVNNIKIAEGAKIIENTQRDLNIALINELQILFNKLKIDFDSVLEAANSKWNFLDFKPGLVGGHCIGVDPYYLAYKSKKIGFNPKTILSGRSVNDQMGKYIVSRFISKFKKKNKFISKKKILVMGLTFKENIRDIRNSKSFEIIKLLQKKGFIAYAFDKNVDIKDMKKLNVKLVTKIEHNFYDGVIILVAHNYFIKIKGKILKSIKKNGLIFDFKNLLKNKNYQI
jgi:UDP-N-acetyl-D-galactosamine dehydrogenase